MKQSSPRSAGTGEGGESSYPFKAVMDARLRHADTELQYEQGATHEFNSSSEACGVPRIVKLVAFTTVGDKERSEMMKLGC